MKRKDKIDCVRPEFSEEIQILLELCFEEPSKELWNLYKNADKKRLINLTKHHKIAPVLFKNIKRQGFYDPNEEYCMFLEQSANQNALFTMKLIKEAGAVFKLFEKKKIEAVLLKGPVAALHIYQNPALRVSKDLDILVPEKDLKAAAAVLLEYGYYMAGHTARIMDSEKTWRILLKQGHHLIFSHPNGVIIELHWRESRRKQSRWDFFKFRQETIIGGGRVYSMNAEDEILYLIIHGSKHNYFRLKWLLDIAAVIKAQTVNWENIIKKAEENDALFCILECWVLVYSLFPDKMPEIYTSSFAVQYDRDEKKWCIMFSEDPACRDKKLKSRALACIADIFQDIESESADLSGIKAEKTRQKVKLLGDDNNFIRKFMPTTLEFEKFYFKDKYYFMYYIVRVVYKLYRAAAYFRFGGR